MVSHENGDLGMIYRVYHITSIHGKHRANLARQQVAIGVVHGRGLFEGVTRCCWARLAINGMKLAWATWDWKNFSQNELSPRNLGILVVCLALSIVSCVVSASRWQPCKRKRDIATARWPVCTGWAHGIWKFLVTTVTRMHMANQP